MGSRSWYWNSAGCSRPTSTCMSSASKARSSASIDSLPLRLWLFADDEGADEVVVVDALAPYRDLIGSRIDTIDGHPIADVLAEIDPIVPRDNAQPRACSCPASC